MAKRKFRLMNFIYGILTALVVLFFVFPIFMIVVTSLKSRVDALAVPPVWIFRPVFDNYVNIFSENNFDLYFRNSLIIATLGTFFALVIGVPAAYSLARRPFRREGDVSFWILSQRMMPPIAVIIPMFILLRTVRLIDTYMGLVVVYMTFNLPFVIWIMRGFFQDLPIDIEESSMVDGCTRFGSFWRVAVPLVAPGLAAAAIFSFLFTWNEFLFALILTGRNTATMPVAVQLFMRETGIDWGRMTAAAVVMMLPTLLFTLFALRFLVRGLTFGAVK
jgi:multiple sugar transport system permease protein